MGQRGTQGSEIRYAKHRKAGPREGQTEELSKSRDKFFPTTYKPYFQALYFDMAFTCYRESIVMLFQADLICIRELLERDSNWRFYMNHASSELPLIPVEEMDKFLRSLKRSVIDSYYNKYTSRQKYLYMWKR